MLHLLKFAKSTPTILLIVAVNWFLFFPNLSHSQTYNFEQFSVNSGIAHPEVYDILQSKDKRIWCATEGGVSVYNGQKFINYTVYDGLYSNDIKKIYEDLEGRIWVINLQGEINYIFKNKVYKAYEINRFKSGGILKDIVQTAGSTYYILTTNKIFTKSKDNKLSDYIVADSIYPGAKFDFSILNDGDSLLYTSTTGSEIIEINISDNSHSVIYKAGNSRTELKRIFDFHKTKDGHLYFGGNLFVKKANNKFIAPDSNLVFVKNIEELNNGNLLLSLEGGGLRIFDKVDNTQIRLNNNGLIAQYVYDAIEDHEENVWIASYGQGLIKFRDASFSKYDEENGFINKVVNDMIVWNGYTWIATDNGLIQMKSNQIIDTLFVKKKIGSLDIVENKGLLVSNYSKVELLDEQFNISHVNNLKPRMQAYSFHEFIYSHNGWNLHISTPTTVETLPIGDIRDILEIDDFMVIRAINKISFIKDNQVIDIPIPELNQFFGFRAMAQLNENSILLASATHFHIISYANGQFDCHNLVYKQFEELNGINGLLIEGNTIWATAKNHLFKIDKNLLLNQDSIHFISNDFHPNFLNSYFIDDGIIRSESGSLYLGTTEGLYIFDSSRKKLSHPSPVISLIDAGALTKIGEKSLFEQNQENTFSTNDHHFYFTMQAISYVNSDNIQYKYRVLGFDDYEEWSDPTSSNTVHFTHIPPGDYTFEFIASNQDGYWNEIPARLSFEVTQVYWKTVKFWLIVALAISSGIGIVIFVISKQKVQRQQNFSFRMLSAFENERKRIAREIHDSVGQMIMLLVRRSKAKGYDDIQNLAESALSETRSITHRLHPASLTQFGFRVALIDLLEEIENKTDLLIYYEVDQIDDYLSNDQIVHLFRIIQECITNIIRHSEATAIEITIKKIKQSIHVVVSDNGKGFDNGKKLKSGLGIESMMERAKFIQAEFSIDSSIGQGTKTTLILEIEKQRAT